MSSIYLDIGPMQESNYTGIPAVTASLAESLLHDDSVHSVFLWGRYIVPPTVVEKLVKIRDGRYFRFHMIDGSHNLKTIERAKIKSEDVVIFPNVKTCGGLFSREMQIVHDFSTLFFPETHHENTVKHHARAFIEDISSNEITFCVSESTRSDVVSYFDVDPDSVIAIHPGVGDSYGEDCNYPVIQEEYVVILGTLEPRKNISLVFGLLDSYPEITDRYKFIFIGRFGWGEVVEDTLSAYPNVIELHKNKRIIFTGYVDEHIKKTLLVNASMMIYPSLFEGFGIPVLEAMRLGTPVVCSYSSSIPEVAGDAGFYFDPYSVNDLHKAFVQAQQQIDDDPARLNSLLSCQAAKFSWGKFYSGIKNAIYK